MGVLMDKQRAQPVVVILERRFQRGRRGVEANDRPSEDRCRAVRRIRGVREDHVDALFNLPVEQYADVVVNLFGQRGGHRRRVIKPIFVVDIEVVGLQGKKDAIRISCESAFRRANDKKNRQQSRNRFSYAAPIHHDFTEQDSSDPPGCRQ